MKVALFAPPIMGDLSADAPRPIAVDAAEECPPHDVHLLQAVLRAADHACVGADLIADGTNCIARYTGDLAACGPAGRAGLTDRGPGPGVLERDSAMTRRSPTPDDKRFSDLVGRIFSDESFALAMEADPEKAFADAGYQLTPEQRATVQNSRGTRRDLGTADDVQVAAIVQPVVSVITTGTPPVVPAVVSSAVVADAGKDGPP